MGSFIRRVEALAISLGAPGLFLVAFLDSSLFSLPEIADLLVVMMVTRHKSRLVLYATSATFGSIAGCLLLYFLGKKGGHALARRRFNSASVERSLAAFRRYGVMAVLIPSLLPPPAPFKIFVLLAGVADITVRQFVLAIAIGRGGRYLLLGILAVEYGDRAMAYMGEHALEASLVAVGLLLIVFVAYLWSTRAQGRKGR